MDLLHKRSFLTGQWRGYRPKLEDIGIIIDLDYTSDLFSNVSGGLNSKSLSPIAGDLVGPFTGAISSTPLDKAS